MNWRKWRAPAVLVLGVALAACGEEEPTVPENLTGTYALVRVDGVEVTFPQVEDFRADGTQCSSQITQIRLTLAPTGTYTYTEVVQNDCDDDREMRSEERDSSGPYFLAGGNQLVLRDLGLFLFELQGDTLYLALVVGTILEFARI